MNEKRSRKNQFSNVEHGTVSVSEGEDIDHSLDYEQFEKRYDSKESEFNNFVLPGT